LTFTKIHFSNYHLFLKEWKINHFYSPAIKQMFNTPILFLIFNRPDQTKEVFKQIRSIRPKQLFIAADGPRSTHPDDVDKCNQARRIVTEGIDWDCELKTAFRDHNAND